VQRIPTADDDVRWRQAFEFLNRRKER
jgi:hypothetical protein